MAKVRLLLDRTCSILSSFKIVVILNITSAEMKTKSADVLLKMTTILKELKIAKLWYHTILVLKKYMQKSPGKWRKKHEIKTSLFLLSLWKEKLDIE